MEEYKHPVTKLYGKEPRNYGTPKRSNDETTGSWWRRASHGLRLVFKIPMENTHYNSDLCIASINRCNKDTVLRYRIDGE
jgi:hypothetical protein